MAISSQLDKKLRQVATILKNPNAKVLFFNGAGISATSDGEPLIPDFRSPGTGLFYNLAKLNLPTPESVFDIDFFRENPKPFYSLCKDLHPELAKFPPTRFHYFMKLVDDHNTLVRIFTQNIDCLERATGIDAEKIVEAHGSFADEYCIECGKKASKEHFTKQLLNDDIPQCEHCKGTLKPAIVFYGEMLPDKFHTCSEKDLTDDVDLCIFAGSSLSVYPFASLASEVGPKSTRLLINREKAGDFVYNPRKTDILALEDCDLIADTIAEYCGWKEELDRLVDAHKKDVKQHAKTAKEMVNDMRMDKNLDDKTKETPLGGVKKDNKLDKTEETVDDLIKNIGGLEIEEKNENFNKKEDGLEKTDKKSKDLDENS